MLLTLVKTKPSRLMVQDLQGDVVRDRQENGEKVAV
jgi:hypothetical protein